MGGSLKVLRVCDEFYSRENLKIGLSPHFYNLAVTLQKKGISQTILAQHADSENVEGIPIVKFSSKRPFSLLRSGDFAFKKIKELKLDFDILQFHNHPYYRLLNYRKQINRPIVETIHGSPSDLMANVGFNAKAIETFYFYYVTKFTAKKLDALVCTSSGISEDLIEKFRLDPAKVHTIPVGIDTNIFYPKETEKKIDILFVGRISAVKNLPALVRAVKIVSSEFPKIKVVLLGASERDNDYPKISNLISALSLSENIKIMSFVKQEKLGDYYRKSKIFALTSFSESTPKAVLEAMACGVPPVITNVRGTKDIREIKDASLSFGPFDYKKLAEHISLLLNNETLRKKFGKNASDAVLKNFNWENSADKYIRLYRSLS